VDDFSLIATIGLGGAIGALLIVLVALGRIPERGRILAVIGSVFALGFAAMAGGALAEAHIPKNHDAAMSQCVYYTALNYPTLSHKDATAAAQAACDLQLANHPDSFDWMWLT
jgi:hypothetical protein